MNTQTIMYETGATSEKVNDLILFTNTTRYLCELRDKIYTSEAKGEINEYNLNWQFYYDLLPMAIRLYKKEIKRPMTLNEKQRTEFAKTYFIDRDTWKKEHNL